MKAITKNNIFKTTKKKKKKKKKLIGRYDICYNQNKNINDKKIYFFFKQKTKMFISERKFHLILFLY